MNRDIPLLGLLLAASAAAQSAETKPDRFAEHARFAPAVQAKLLFFSVAGGAGDQWFAGVDVQGKRVTASMPGGKFGLAVTVKDDDSVSAGFLGEKSETGAPMRDLPNGGRSGPYTYGYKQVDPNLQQPFLTGGGLSLWGWTLNDAKTSKLRYAPAMADSRIKSVAITPKGTLFVTGYTDGGNTILRGHPRNHNITLETGFDAGGGGGGKSTWLFDLDARTGNPIGVLACRGTVVCHAYDAWNRIVVGGGAVLKTGQGAAFGFSDGAGLLMCDYEWKNPVLAAHLGAKAGEDKGPGGMVWAIDIDSNSGLMGVAGWMEGSPEGVNAIQAKNGGGKDGFLAVIRLWTADDAAKAKQAEADAKKAASEPKAEAPK